MGRRSHAKKPKEIQPGNDIDRDSGTRLAIECVSVRHPELLGALHALLRGETASGRLRKSLRDWGLVGRDGRLVESVRYVLGAGSARTDPVPPPTASGIVPAAAGTDAA